ncbi:hypothetical protein SAMN02745165_02413 [Malonomonas rubra DSM 5091]|uniref:Uncharacterized protein n=1 Tax=Malonomonas rubra DSM 5091 TaxID=1122189 RepID=A0A1M6JE28_MALRU|nr:hypothetical protein [Malonomonas rubra]SHJ44961.1 hypothetical protein SAMN02745165_02413 [Malonomonas rubra DSM 5091]
MPDTILAPGDQIQARCTKCKLNTESIIVSLVDNVPEKVECTLCSRKHKYRPPIAPKRAYTKQAPRKVESEQKKWENQLAVADQSKVIEYSMAAPYKPNALISHPVFGLGLVQGNAGSRKIEVLFSTGRKIMRCK